MRSARPSTAGQATRLAATTARSQTPAQSYLPAHPDTLRRALGAGLQPRQRRDVHVRGRERAGQSPLPHRGCACAHDGRTSSCLQARHRLRAGPRPAHRKRAALPPGRVVASRATLGSARAPSKSSSRPRPAPRGRSERSRAQPKRAAAKPARAAARRREGTGSIPLPLAPGTADADPAQRPGGRRRRSARAVRRWSPPATACSARAYLYGGAHGTSLDTLQPAYDCSSAVSYVLHAGGVLGTSALDSTDLRATGSPARAVTSRSTPTPAHTFIYVAGLRFDTVEAPAYDTGPNSGKPGPKWRVSDPSPAGPPGPSATRRAMSRYPASAHSRLRAAGRSRAHRLHQPRRPAVSSRRASTRRSPQNTGEPPAPAPPTPPLRRPPACRRRPRSALAAFASCTSNWTIAP